MVENIIIETKPIKKKNNKGVFNYIYSMQDDFVDIKLQWKICQLYIELQSYKTLCKVFDISVEQGYNAKISIENIKQSPYINN